MELTLHYHQVTKIKVLWLQEKFCLSICSLSVPVKSFYRSIGTLQFGPHINFFPCTCLHIEWVNESDECMKELMTIVWNSGEKKE